MKQIGGRRKASRGLASNVNGRAFFSPAVFGDEHRTEKERRGKAFGLHWAKARKKGLLVIIKSLTLIFCQIYFPRDHNSDSVLTSHAYLIISGGGGVQT